MANELSRQYGYVFLGRTLVQAKGQIEGNRYVFVKLVGNKNEMIFPPTGGIVKNPFKRKGKMYAGDLVEYHYNGGATNGHDNAEVILLKTFEVAKAATGTEVMIVRNGFRHIPEVGNILMKAPATFSATGTAVTVTAVEKTTDAGKDVWKLTLSAAAGSLAVGDVLVEAEAAGTSKMLVQNPNAVMPCDYDFAYEPAVDDTDYDGARYFITPMLAGIMYKHRMSPIPPAVEALNQSRIDGWFELKGI